MNLEKYEINSCVKGSVISVQDNEINYIGFLKEGLVKKFLKIKEDHQKPLVTQLVGNGQWFGIESSFHKGNFTFNFEALISSQYYLIPIDDFKDKFELNFLSDLAAQVLDETILLLDQRDLQKYHARKRVLSFLVHSHSLTNLLELEITHEDISEICSMGRSHVSSILKGLEKLGLIEISYNTLSIHNIQGIQDILAGDS